MPDDNRTITDADANAIAKALLDNASDPEAAKQLADVLQRYLDQMLGRGARKVLWYLIIFLIGLGVSNHKAEVWDFLIKLAK